MSPILAAVAASFLRAATNVVFSRAIQKGADPKVTAIAFYLGSSVLIAAFIPLPQLIDIDLMTALLLALNGVLWVAITCLDLKAFQYLHASSCLAIDTLSVAGVCIVGYFVWGESLDPPKAAGIAVIVAALLLAAGVRAIPPNRGLAYKLTSVALVSAAFSIDKHMSTVAPQEVAMFSGYCIPCLFLVAANWKSVSDLPKVLTKGSYAMLLVPGASILAYALTFQALSSGDMGSIYAIIRAGLLFVLLFEIIVLKARENLMRKAFICCCCVAGAAILGS